MTIDRPADMQNEFNMPLDRPADVQNEFNMPLDRPADVYIEFNFKRCSTDNRPFRKKRPFDNCN
jgi:hypothetical protein